jgi:hypothetical protein
VSRGRFGGIHGAEVGYVLMRNYVAYHKVAAWGNYDAPNDDGVFAHYSRHSLSKLEQTLNQNVWVISGERLSGSMVYKLCAVYQPEYIEQLADGGANIVGQGSAIHPAIELNEYTWFTRLLREQSNFRFGLNEIRHPDIRDGLQALQQEWAESVPLLGDRSPDEWFTQAEYVSALRQLEMQISPQQRAMLRAHAQTPGRVMSVFELAAAGGSSSDNLTYSLYGRLGHLLGNVLEPFIATDSGIQPIWTRYIGDDFRPGPDAPVHWIMHPELAAALEELGWATLARDENTLRDIELAESEWAEEPPTIRQAIVMSRIGQGLFRAQLLSYWTGCAVTGIKVTEALRASHIKPWSESTNQERLDYYNGLLLVGTLDLLFDAGLISFKDSGHILISDMLLVDDRAALGLRENMHLRNIEAAHLPYLAFHRENVFRRLSDTANVPASE